MQENIEIAEVKKDGYEVIVTNITWNEKSTYSKYASKKDFSKSLPSQFTFNLPETFASKTRTANHMWATCGQARWCFPTSRAQR